MAIQINSSLDLTNGVSVDQAYLRVEHQVDIFGVKIVYDVYPYVNRDTYLEDKISVNDGGSLKTISLENFKTSHVLQYDKVTDGNDILQLVHDDLFSYITEDEIYKKPLYDSSTGEPLLDPSTGALITEDVIFRTKFANAADVSISDLN